MYEDRYGEQVFLCGANMYDNLDILIESFEKTEGNNINDVVDDLLKVKDKQGAIGLFSIDEEGIVQSFANVKQIINGKAVLPEE
jgi:hypothetical protein